MGTACTETVRQQNRACARVTAYYIMDSLACLTQSVHANPARLSIKLEVVAIRGDEVHQVLQPPDIVGTTLKPGSKLTLRPAIAGVHLHHSLSHPVAPRVVQHISCWFQPFEKGLCVLTHSRLRHGLVHSQSQRSLLTQAQRLQAVVCNSEPKTNQDEAAVQKFKRSPTPPSTKNTKVRAKQEFKRSPTLPGTKQYKSSSGQNSRYKKNKVGFLSISGVKAGPPANF